jgi:hypothetical protein
MNGRAAGVIDLLMATYDAISWMAVNPASVQPSIFVI